MVLLKIKREKTMKLTLETERLILRPFNADDAEAMFYGWTSDHEVTKYLSWPTHQSIDDTKFVLNLWEEQYEKPERLNFAICLKDSGQLIGGIDVVGYEEGIPVIGYNLAKKHWNNGYMTEACRCVVNYLFSSGFKEVRIDAMTENAGSQKVIAKCGGKLLKTEEVPLPLKNKTAMVNMYIIRSEV